jgi:hypothetical protein
MGGGQSGQGIRFRDNHAGTIRGYLYYNNSSEKGFLNSAANWSVRVTDSHDVQIYGSLTVGNSTSSDIYMTDTDEGTRRIHCNSNRIGFLNEAASWGSYCSDNGDWTTDFISYAGQSHRSPIFYDNNNSAYYLDPNSTSYLYHLQLSGASYFRPSTWIQMDGSYGMYWPNTNGAHLEGNTLSSYGSIAIRGSRNGWRGIHFYDGGTAPHLMFDGSSNGGIYYESGSRWASYYLYSNNCWGFGTSTTNSAYNIYCPTGVYSGGRVDGTIFYDSNNTAYYTDPASTSNLNSVTAVDFNSTSDIKLKTNVTQIRNSIKKISQLNGVSFNWKNTNKPSLGVIAQEVEKVFPELVNDSETKTVNYNGLIGVLIEAIKELKGEVEELKSKIHV